jgi:hypothetical protein
MDTKTSPNVGSNTEVQFPFRQEAMNSRTRGGETADLEAYPKDRQMPPVGKQRNTEGIKGSTPLQVTRPGERRY